MPAEHAVLASPPIAWADARFEKRRTALELRLPLTAPWPRGDSLFGNAVTDQLTEDGLPVLVADVEDTADGKQTLVIAFGMQELSSNWLADPANLGTLRDSVVAAYRTVDSPDVRALAAFQAAIDEAWGCNCGRAH